jgi:hypothetical protein
MKYDLTTLTNTIVKSYLFEYKDILFINFNTFRPFQLHLTIQHEIKIRRMYDF